jgi:methyl-accepting chemotaxis protein
MLPVEVPMHEHREITQLTMAVERLAESQRELTTDVKELADEAKNLVRGMSQIELILERMSQMKSNTAESFARVHKRIDEVATTVRDIQSDCDKDGCQALKLAISKHEVKEAKHEAKMAELGEWRKDSKDFQNKMKFAVLTLVIAALAELILK